METAKKLNSFSRATFVNKKQSKNRAFQKEEEKKVFFTYSCTNAIKVPKKNSGCQWGLIKIDISMLKQTPLTPCQDF